MALHKKEMTRVRTPANSSQEIMSQDNANSSQELPSVLNKPIQNSSQEIMSQERVNIPNSSQEVMTQDIPQQNMSYDKPKQNMSYERNMSYDRPSTSKWTIGNSLLDTIRNRNAWIQQPTQQPKQPTTQQTKTTQPSNPITDAIGKRNRDNADADQVFNNLMLWLDVWEQFGVETPAYWVAKNRKTKLDSIAWLPVDQLVSSVANNNIMLWSNTMKDLQTFYPEKYEQVLAWIENERKLKNINGFGDSMYENLNKQTVRTNDNENLYDDTFKKEEKVEEPTYISKLAWTVFDSVQWQFGSDAEEYISFVQEQLNNPNIQTQTKKVIEMQWERKKLLNQINEIEEDIRDKANSATPEWFLSAYIGEATEDLRDKLETMDMTLQTEQSILTSYTDQATQNIEVYAKAKEMQQAEDKMIAEAQQAELEYMQQEQQNQFENALKLENLSMDQQKAEFERQKYYSDMEIDQWKDAQELSKQETDRLYDMLWDENTPQQVKADLYDYLFNGMWMWSGAMLSVGWTWLSTDFSWNQEMIDKYAWEARVKNNNPSGMTRGVSQWLKDAREEAWIDINKGSNRPANEWNSYIKFDTIWDGIKAMEIALSRWDFNVNSRLQKRVWTHEWPNYAKQVMAMAGIEDQNQSFSELTPQQSRDLTMAVIKKESPWLYKELEWMQSEVAYQPDQPYNPYRWPGAEWWWLSNTQQKLIAVLGKPLFGGNPSDKDTERLEELIRWMWENPDPTEVMREFTFFDPGNEKELGEWLRNAIQSNMVVNDYDFIGLSDQIQRWNITGAVNKVERNIESQMKTNEWDNYISKSKVENIVWQSTDVANFLQKNWWVWRARKYTDMTFSNMLWDKFFNNYFTTDSKTLSTKVTNLVAKMRSEMVGTNVTEAEEKMIEPLIPSVDDTVSVFMMKLQNLQEEPLRQLNNVRENYSLPTLDYNSLFDTRYLADQYRWTYQNEQVWYQSDPLYWDTYQQNNSNQWDPMWLWYEQNMSYDR